MKAAQRVGVRPWRDPRLILGVMLVLLSTIVGARAFAAHDNTVAYWSLRSSVTAGQKLDKADLVSTKVRLGSSAAGSYLRVGDELPARIDELVWSRDVDGGVLVESTALVVAADRSAGELPLHVASGSYPHDLRPGQRVDVWVGPGPGEPSAEKSSQVLASARILSTGSDDDSLAGSLARTILVGVADGQVSAKTLSAISAGHVTLVRVP